MLIGIVIAVNEVLFWVLIAAGLVARYRLRRPRLGARLLIAAPLVDLVLLAVSVIDLRSGATPHTGHVLAAVYIGVSVGFGHRMIQWADVRYAHRYAGGPAPTPKPAKGTAARARLDRQGWFRHALAYGVGVTLMGLAALMIGPGDGADTFLGFVRIWTLALVIDGAVSLWPSQRRDPGPDPQTTELHHSAPHH